MIQRGGYRAHFGQRLGTYSPEIRTRLALGPRRIWIQAVSVGELLVALKLIDALREHLPDLPLILSTTTTTGFRLAQTRVGKNVEVVYSPIDLPWVVTRCFRVLRPAAMVIVDGGLWPNQLWAARQYKLPTALVNARLSPHSEKRFRRFSRLASQLFAMLDLVCVPEISDLARWKSLGVSEAKIYCTGSIKYDDLATAALVNPDKIRSLLETIGTSATRRVLLAGSTHPGEEILIARVFLALRQLYPDLFLILAPRHVERTSSIQTELKPLGLRVQLRTALQPDAVFCPSVDDSLPPDVLLLNTTGELGEWYAVATIVFIGKSLTAIGGQNPAEAISVGKAVIVGPHMENFRELVALLLKNDAIIQVDGVANLQLALAKLLGSESTRAEMVEKARDLLATHRGAAKRTAALLLTVFKFTA